MRKPEHNEGLNYMIGSNDEVGAATKRSDRLRGPIKDKNYTGEPTPDKVRMVRIAHCFARLRELADNIRDTRKHYASLHVAAPPKHPWKLILLDFLIIFGDGLLMGPVVSNCVETFNSDVLKTIVGLAVATIMGVGGIAIASSVRMITAHKIGKPIAVLLVCILGGIAGALIGHAGDGTMAGILIRGILTMFSLAFMASTHFSISEAIEARRPLVAARVHLKSLLREEKKTLRTVHRDQRKILAEYEHHNRREAARIEGFITGKQAREENIRATYVRRRFLGYFDRLLGCLLFAFVVGIPLAANADTFVVVVDDTDISENMESLIDITIDEANIKYGDRIVAYSFGCDGLVPVHNDRVIPGSKAGHRQDLARAKKKLKVVLIEAIGTQNEKCSPLIDSLTLLAFDLNLRQEQGEAVRLFVISDFETNNDRTSLKEQLFTGMEVTIAFPPASGRDPKRRMQAMEFVRKLFAGSTLHFAY